MPEEIRRIAISHIKNESLTNDESIRVKKFLHYLEAYCAEMKCDELDVLFNDEHYDKVYSLYKNVMYRH